MRKQFVIISGLPGSGKSTLARPLAVGLTLPLLDKDDILDALFESKGIGDAAWRRGLSRESDARPGGSDDLEGSGSGLAVACSGYARGLRHAHRVAV